MYFCPENPLENNTNKVRCRSTWLRKILWHHVVYPVGIPGKYWPAEVHSHCTTAEPMPGMSNYITTSSWLCVTPTITLIQSSSQGAPGGAWEHTQGHATVRTLMGPQEHLPPPRFGRIHHPHPHTVVKPNTYIQTPGAQHGSPGKIIVKYFLKTFTIESCYDFRD